MSKPRYMTNEPWKPPPEPKCKICNNDMVERKLPVQVQQTKDWEGDITPKILICRSCSFWEPCNWLGQTEKPQH